VWLVFLLLLIVSGNSHILWLSMFAGVWLVVLAWFPVVDGRGPAVLWGVIGGAVRRVL